MVHGRSRVGYGLMPCKAGSKTTTTLYNESGQWLGEYSASAVPMQQVVWLENYPIAVFSESSAGVPALGYVQPDHLGTPRVIIDATRNVPVWEWALTGEAFGADAANEDTDGDGIAFGFALRFPGQQATPESGLNYNYQRDYDAGVGRYVQSDPIGLAGGKSTFSYSLARPLDRVDYDGLETVVIKSGSVEGNPFGHIAIATTGHGVYSYGTKHLYGSNTVDYLGSQVAERFVEVVRLNTSPTQEEIIRGSMENSRRAPYSATSNNCATAVQSALFSAGLVGNHGHLLPGQVYTDALLSPSKIGSDVIMKNAPIPTIYSDF